MSLELVVALLLQTAPSAPAATPVAPADAAARECRNEKDSTSRVPQRVCRTKAEWAEIARAARSQRNDTAPMRQDSVSGYK